MSSNLSERFSLRLNLEGRRALRPKRAHRSGAPHLDSGTSSLHAVRLKAAAIKRSP